MTLKFPNSIQIQILERFLYDSDDMYVRPVHKMKYMQSICFDIPLLLCVKGKKKSYLRHTHFDTHTHIQSSWAHLCPHSLFKTTATHTPPIKTSTRIKKAGTKERKGKKTQWQKAGERVWAQKKKQRQRRTKLYEGHQAGLASRVRSDSGARWPRLINAAPQMKGSAFAIIPCHNAITQQSDSKIEGSQPPGMIKVLTDLIEWLK